METSNFKQMARDFLLMTAKSDSREAFKKYVGQGFKHHNVYFKGDADSLMLAMEENAKKIPRRFKGMSKRKRRIFDRLAKRTGGFY